MTDAGPDALEIVPLTPERFPDLATLFEAGGDPKWCWCTWFRYSNRDWSNSTAEGNRTDLEGRAGEEPAAGLVAYRDSQAIGWISLGPRESYARFDRARVLAPIDDAPVWSIVCFVVARQARGHGVARALLDAGIDYARDHGATMLEAYPADLEGSRIASASVNMGTLSMFERRGFEVVARRQANAKSAPRPIVRLAI